MYFVAALFFFLLGGAEALLIRLQLAQPDAGVESADMYNQLFTMYGTTMIFLAIVGAPVIRELEDARLFAGGRGDGSADDWLRDRTDNGSAPGPRGQSAVVA